MTMTAAEFNAHAHERKHFEALAALGWLAIPAGADEVAAVKAVQAELGLEADGKLGMGTIAALRARHGAASGACGLAVPHGYAEIRRVYGDPRETAGEGGRLNVDPAWKAAQIVTATLHNGQRFPCHRAIAVELATVFGLACKLSGYNPRCAGVFVPRCINWDPANDPSIHTFAVAVDFNPQENGRGNAASALHKNRLFVAVFECFGWQWGGDFPTTDPMHFQRATGA